MPLIKRKTIVDFPEKDHSNFATIEAIYVKDNNKHSTAYASVTAGGIGQKFAKIKLKSDRGDGFNFTITIYGRYPSY